MLELAALSELAHDSHVKPYTVSGNLICPDFASGRTPEIIFVDDIGYVKVTGRTVADAYEQLESEQPGELLYMSKGLVEPPSDVER